MRQPLRFKLEYELWGHKIGFFVEPLTGKIEPDAPVWHWESLPKNPFIWEWADLMELAQRIKEYHDAHEFSGNKIAMIKACRYVAFDMQLITKDGTVDSATDKPFLFGLRDAKDLVELLFADWGNSNIINEKRP